MSLPEDVRECYHYQDLEDAIATGDYFGLPS